MAIRQRTVHEARVIGGDAKVEDYLDKKGVQWTFHPAVPVDQFDADKSLRNQARIAQPLDEKRVEQYAEDMRRGDEFPPVIAHGQPGKYVIADGNHRLAGATRAKRPLAVYHVVGDARTIVLITFEANTKHGLPTSEEERIQHALYLIDNGSSIPEAAQVLSLPRKTVEKASIARSTSDRFRDAKLPAGTVEKLTEPIRRRLANISTDEGFAAAVNLAADAGMASNEVWELVTNVNLLRSSDKQVAFVQEQRENVWGERIAATGGGVFKRGQRTPLNTPKARLGAVTTIIGNLPEDMDEITKAWVGPERDEMAKKMRATARRLNEIAKALTT